MQYHYVIFFDDKVNKWGIDEETKDSRFSDGTIFDTKSEEWVHANESTVADIEDETYRELLDILAQVNRGELVITSEEKSIMLNALTALQVLAISNADDFLQDLSERALEILE